MTDTKTNLNTMITTNTKVVCLKRKGMTIIQGCDVYIGRAVQYGDGKTNWNLPESKWHNPYRIQNYDSIETVMALYEHYLRQNNTLLSQLSELRGKILGCWCKKTGNELCHGDILIKLLSEMESRNNN